jgi:hypothetical protein
MTAWHTTSARISGLGLAALILMAGPIDAAPQADTASYFIRSNMEQADGSLSSAELLTVASKNGNATITVVQQANGATAKAIAPIDEHGIVSIATSDPALICYNTAQGLLAKSAQPNGSALSLSFAGNTVKANRLADVQLRETTMLTASHAAIGRTTCSITRIIDTSKALPA